MEEWQAQSRQERDRIVRDGYDIIQEALETLSREAIKSDVHI